MATQKIYNISYEGVTYEFYDNDAQDKILKLDNKVDKFNDAQKEDLQDEVTRAMAAEAAILASQVSKEAGKGLSTNDYTNADKAKVDSLSVMTGATETTDGASGIVPKPVAGENHKFLCADGTWASPDESSYPIATETVDGLMAHTDKAKLNKVDLKSLDDYSCVTTVTESAVTQVYGNGKSKVIAFNRDGSITETITNSDQTVERFKTTFEDGTIRREEIS